MPRATETPWMLLAPFGQNLNLYIWLWKFLPQNFPYFDSVIVTLPEIPNSAPNGIWLSSGMGTATEGKAWTLEQLVKMDKVY